MSSTVLQESLWLLNHFGGHPEHMHLPKKMLISIPFIVLCLVAMYLMVSHVFTHWRGITTLEDNADGFPSLYQTLCKVILGAYHRKGLIQALRTIKSFKISHLQPNTELHEMVKDMHDHTRKIYQTFRISVILCGIVLSGKAVLYGQRMLPAAFTVFCDEESNWCYAGTFFYQLLATIFACSITIGADGLLLSLISFVYIELEALKYSFRNLDVKLDVEGDDDACFKELAVLVQQHDRVLKFMADINNIYQTLFMHEFAMVMVIICFIIFAINVEGASLPFIIKTLPFLLAYHLQLFIATAAGEYLTNQALEVSDAAYDSDWYRKHQPRLARGILLVMQRAGQPVRLKVGGLWNLQLQTFVVVLKTSVSIYALMQTFNE